MNYFDWFLHDFDKFWKHDFWKNLNKVYKQNLIDYIHETLHHDNNLVKDYLKMENMIYKSSIYLFTYYLIQNLY